MKFRAATHRLLLFARTTRHGRNLHHPPRHFTTFFRKLQSSPARDSINGGGGSSSSSQGNSFLVPGATVGTILMLGACMLVDCMMIRRIRAIEATSTARPCEITKLETNNKSLECENGKSLFVLIEEAREKGIELEFHPDIKATFLSFLPLRSISRFWGFLTSVEYPIWLRPHVYKAWARAFHSNLEEAALPVEEYASLRDFFVRTLKEGTRPIDSDPCCLISPVDGTVLRFGELKGAGAMIEQVKGFSYSVSSLLGERSFLPMTAKESIQQESGGENNSKGEETQKSWWRVSLASPKVRSTTPECPMKGLFYCVIYLKPGDYHRIHSPVDWNVLVRRHFSGRLYPMNERATRTIRNLYVENERVVLEGQWQEGYMAMAAIGATSIGSIELFVEPTLRTNRPRKKLLHLEPPQERVYDPEGTGIMLKKGDEVAAFNMGSTVVLVFQAPVSSGNEGLPYDFRFCVKRGDRIRMGEALGRWHDA